MPGPRTYVKLTEDQVNELYQVSQEPRQVKMTNAQLTAWAKEQFDLTEAPDTTAISKILEHKRDVDDPTQNLKIIATMQSRRADSQNRLERSDTTESTISFEDDISEAIQPNMSISEKLHHMNALIMVLEERKLKDVLRVVVNRLRTIEYALKQSSQISINCKSTPFLALNLEKTRGLKYLLIKSNGNRYLLEKREGLKILGGGKAGGPLYELFITECRACSQLFSMFNVKLVSEMHDLLALPRH